MNVEIGKWSRTVSFIGIYVSNFRYSACSNFSFLLELFLFIRNMFFFWMFVKTKFKFIHLSPLYQSFSSVAAFLSLVVQCCFRLFVRLPHKSGLNRDSTICMYCFSSSYISYLIYHAQNPAKLQGTSLIHSLGAIPVHFTALYSVPSQFTTYLFHAVTPHHYNSPSSLH